MNLYNPPFMKIALPILILFIFSSAHAQKVPSATDTIIVCGNKVPILRTAGRTFVKSFLGGANTVIANDTKLLENQLKLQRVGNTRYLLNKLKKDAPGMNVSLYENEIRAYELCDSLQGAIKSQQYLAQQTAKIKYNDSIKAERDLQIRKANSIQSAAIRHNEEIREEVVEKEQAKKKNNEQADYKKTIIEKYGTATTNKIFAHQTWVGMTTEECELSIGKPRKKETTNVANVTLLIWTYKEQEMYFSNNKVVKILQR